MLNHIKILIIISVFNTEFTIKNVIKKIRELEITHKFKCVISVVNVCYIHHALEIIKYLNCNVLDLPMNLEFEEQSKLY